MFAKLFKKNDVFDTATLTALPTLEQSQQLVLLDQYLAYCKSHQQIAIDETAVHELLRDLPDSAVAAPGISLEIAKRAMSAVQDVAMLATLLDRPSLGTLAAKRLCKLLPLDSDHAVNQHERLFQARLQFANAADIQVLSERVTTAEQAAWLVIRAPAETKQKLLAMAVLQDEVGLTALEKISRGKDKGCNRLAREGLDKIRGCRRQLAEHLDALNDVHSSAQRELKIAPKDLDGLIVQRKKLNQLHARHEQLVQNIREARDALGTAAPISELAENPFVDLDLSVPSAQDNPYPRLIAAVQSLYAQLAQETPDAQALGQHSQQLETQRQAWLAADSGFPPSASQHEQFEALLDATYTLLTAWRQLSEIHWQALAQDDVHGDEQGRTAASLAQWLTLARQANESVHWPAAVPLPTVLATLRHDITQAAAQQRDLGQQQVALTQELNDISATLQGLIDNGEFKKALSALGRCRKLQKQGAKGNEKLINRISTQLGELSDWQQYAASPKRDELLQSMAAMIATPLSAESQRERIKALREQWNALGPLAKEQLQMQQQFDELADQAFEICREHFAEQSKQRSDNLIARKALCDQLQQYLDNTDWQQADMRAAETILRQARQEWRRHHPCDRKALKAVEARFEELQSALHQRVKNTWDRNVKAKEDLVSQALALVEQDGTEGLAAAAKQLQAQWRDVGTTPRGADQRLWKKFRDACDDVFARIEQQRSSQRSAAEQLLQALVDDIAAFDTEAGSIADAESGLAALRDRASDLRLDAKHRDALKNHDQRLRTRRSQAKQAKREQRLAEFRHWDEAISQAEIAGITMDSPHALFNARIAGRAETLDLLALTMEAEIAADIAGPAEEQGARMTLQVELMNRGVRNMQLVDNQELLARWCSCGPKSEQDNALRERFFAALLSRLT
ncbi:MAG: DUF349 domain-containing protein [Pseudomonadales bacterium]|nr:DUF349 domain-containing protein [Pseudomonadales bacterium]